MKLNFLLRTAIGALSVLFFALTFAHAQGTFTYLDDEAEPGGYDVTATVQKLPVEFILARQGNGDGYSLKATSTGVELSLLRQGTLRPLASVRTPVGNGLLVAQRRGPQWRVITGGRVVLQAEDAQWHDGKIGYRGGLADVRVQPVEEIHFEDDFMRVASEVAMEKAKDNPSQGVKVAEVKTEETLWRAAKGSWSTSGISENEQAQVAQSANPFAFQSKGVGSNLAVSGRPFWSDYEMEVSVKPQGATALGVAIYVQDERNYLLMHWQDKGPLQLRALVNGQARVLDAVDAGFDQKQWYRLRLTVAGGVVRAFVDDAEALRARTGFFGRGEVGLYSENPAADAFAAFDDVRVRSLHDVHDDFRTPVPGRWQNAVGSWSMANAAMPAGPQGSYTVMGATDWQDYTASANISLPPDAVAGLLLHHQSGRGAYVLRIAGSKSRLPYAGKAQIFKIFNSPSGTPANTVLVETAIGSRFDGKTTRWSFSGERGYLKATVERNGEDVRILDTFDDTIRDGRAGLYAQRGAQGVPRLTDFTVEFPREHQTWAKVPDLYELERQAETMGGWSTPQGLWATANPMSRIRATSVTAPAADADAAPTAAPTTAAPATSTPAAGTPATAATGNKILWHKGAFWGDGSVRFKLPALTAGQNLMVILGDGKRRVGVSQANSFALTLRVEAGLLKAALVPADLSGTELKAPASRNTSTAAAPHQGQIKIEGAVDSQTVTVERRGSFVIVRAGADGESHTLLAARIGS